MTFTRKCMKVKYGTCYLGLARVTSRTKDLKYLVLHMQCIILASNLSLWCGICI
jgi:hypothetical protein